MTAVSFFVPGDPKAQPRARACIRGKHAGVYDPGTANVWKYAIADAWRAVAQAPFQCPVSLMLEFYFRRPLGHFGSGRNAEVLKPGAPRFHTSKPDLDNLAKAVMDELTRLLAWADDRLVWRLEVHRAWASVHPGCRIQITPEDGGCHES